MYCYGNRPNVLLAVFGLITSIPEKEASDFSSMKEFEDLEELSKEMVSEHVMILKITRTFPS